jgi:DNA-binding transcriptional LysR family regulator
VATTWGDTSPLAIELRHLRYFLAVAEELHFGRAAQRLHLSQPPLSRAIRQLEEKLGVTLLERTSRNVTPTAAGLIFAEQARAVLARLHVAVAETQRAGGTPPPLRIGCYPFLAPERQQEFLDALHERLPGLQTEVVELFALHQIASLHAADLDVGVLICSEEQVGLEIEPLFREEPLVALVPESHRLTTGETVGPDDVRGEILVMLRRAVNPAFHDAVLTQCEAAGYSFRSVLEVESLRPREAVLAVAGGLGVTFVPSWVTDRVGVPSPVAAFPLDPPIRLPQTMVAWRPDPPRELSATIAVVREVAQSLHGGHDRDSRGIEGAHAGI